MLVVGLLVLGVLALSRLPLEFLPSISSSSISVSADYTGSSPEEITRLIVQPLEDSLGTLNGLDRMASTASATEGRVSLEFVGGTDMDLAAVEVRDRVDRVRDRLPADLRQIRMRRFQSTDIPVLRMHITADWDGDRLFSVAEDVIQPRLERLEGVAQIEIRGVQQREIQVRLDAGRMAAHRVDPRALAQTLRTSNQTLSVGDVTEGSRKLLLRVVGDLGRLSDIRALPIGNGLRLEDVAEVAYAFPRQTRFSFFNGTQALSIRVYKASNANLLDTVDRVKTEFDGLVAEPRFDGLSARIYHDSSLDVRRGLAQLRDAGLIGGMLAVFAVFLFLRRLRTTLLVAIAMPVSVVATFVIMYLLRQAGWSDTTLNVVSLMGLVLALGMLVDSAIVVIESIYRRAQEFGEDGKTAALRGASEVAMPIVASTATTLCVFMPVIFDQGGSGFYSLYFKEVGTVVCIVMVASLLVALTVVPMVASVLLKRGLPKENRLIDRIGGLYVKVLRLTLRFRFAFVACAALLLWGSFQLLAGIERTFGSRSESRQVTLAVDVPRTFTVDQTAEVFDELYARFDRQRDALEIADISYDFDEGTGRNRRGGRGGKRMELYLLDEEESTRSVSEIREAVRGLLPTLPGVEVKIQQGRRHWGGSGVQIEVAGDDPTVLALVARDVAERVASVPGVEDVDTSLESGDDEIRVSVARDQALMAGISSQAVAQTVSSALSDRALDQMRTDTGEVDVIMQYREEDRATLDKLRALEVRGGSSDLPLDVVARFDQTPGPQTIERENRRAKLTVSANASSPMASMMALRGAGVAMAGVAMPPGYSWSFGRWNRMQQQDGESFNFTLILAGLLVYMLMAALFESYTHPLAIMASVPFAFLGVGVALRVASQPRDSLTDLGFVILVGVVVNNAIILVDHINRLRREGLGRDEAILTGGRHRLRAILMTATTTILGLLPMTAPLFLPELFGSVEGRAGNWAPVGLVILGGLTTSTFLTLVIIPTVYSLIDDMSAFARRVVRAS